MNDPKDHNWIKTTPRLRKCMPLFETDKVLDVGCLNGDMSYYLASMGMEVVGIDKDPLMIKEANKRLSPDIKVSFYRHDIDQRLHFNSETFDCVYMGEVIEHLKHPYKVLKDILRVLKPDGFILLSTPSPTYWKQIIMAKYRVKMRINRVLEEGRGEGDEKEHLYCWTLYTLIRLLKEAGFIYQQHDYCRGSWIVKARKPLRGKNV